MKRKSRFLSVFLSLAMVLVASACSPQQGAPSDDQGSSELEPAAEIVLFNWTDYMNPDVLALFEQETGIKVVEDYFSSNEELLAKLKGGASGYSLVVPSDYMAGIMISEGLLTELDRANIPNIENLGERFRGVYFDPGNKYCVPYQWGTTGIGYLEGEVEKPVSWAAIFEPDPDSPAYGRISLLDDSREAFAAALIYLGYDPNTTDMTQLEEAKALLIKAKAGVASIDSDTYDENLAAGEHLLVHGWNGDLLLSQEENESVMYTIPDEGGVIYMEAVCIPKTATPEQKLAGEQFLNFILRADVGAMLSEYIYYASPNAAAEAEMDPEFLANEAVYPPQEVLDRLHELKPLGEFDAVYQRLWDEVKSASTP